MVVPAALGVRLAPQRHAVQALAHGDDVLCAPGLVPCGTQSLSHQTALVCVGIPWQCSPPSSNGIHSPAPLPSPLSQPSPVTEAALELTAAGCYLSEPSGGAAAGQGQSPSQCWGVWTQQPGPAGSAAARSNGHGSSLPLALKRKHSQGGDARSPHPRPRPCWCVWVEAAHRASQGTLTALGLGSSSPQG